MTTTITHHTPTAATNNPTYDVSKNVWNEGHDVVFDGNDFIRIKRTLTSAELLAIFTTPIQLVAAPGVGKVVVPITIALSYRYNTIAYTDNGGDIIIMPNGGGAPQDWASAAFHGVNFWTKTTHQFRAQGYSLAIVAAGLLSSAYDNKALMIANDTANPTLGNGTIIVTVNYQIFDLT